MRRSVGRRGALFLDEAEDSLPVPVAQRLLLRELEHQPRDPVTAVDLRTPRRLWAVLERLMVSSGQIMGAA